MRAPGLALLLTLSAGCATGPLSREVSIGEVSPSSWTAKTKQQLQGVLDRHDLRPFLFTRSVQIQPRVIPHPKPVLTLDTYFADKPDALLSVFLHQQMHWYLDRQPDRVQAVIDGLKRAFPELPRGKSEVAASPDATYRALIAAWLEVEADRYYLGDAAAEKVVGSFGYHRWIYRTVLEDRGEIGALLRAHGLVPPPLK